MKSPKTNPHLHLVLVLLIIGTALVYSRSIGAEFQNLDDPWYVTQNRAIAGFSWSHSKEVFSSFYVGNYAPVQMLSYMLDYSIWGMWPGGFLLTNIIIHTTSGLLLYRLFLRFSGDCLFATVAAALFLLHPVQVESVAWISQRKNVLAMLFFLVAWECYCWYREAGAGRKKLLVYALSLSAFVLSLLAKSISVVFPIVLVAYDYCYSPGKRRFALLDKIPFALTAGIIAIVTIYSQRPEVGEGGRVAGLHGGSAFSTVFTMMPVFCRYLGLILWPSSLSAEYNPPIHHTADAIVLGSLLLLLTVAWSGWRLFCHDRRLGFWVVFFFVALLPVSQIVPLVTLMNDRYLYFPMLSVAALGGAAASALLRSGEGFFRLVYPALALLLIALSTVTYTRVGIWRNPVTLWSDAASKVPDSPRIWSNLGNAQDTAGNRAAAIYAFKRGLDLEPDNVQILYHSGTMYMQLGDNDQAAALLKRLLELLPNHIMGLVSFGDVCLQRGDYAGAEKKYLRAHQLQPEAVDPLIKLGNMAVVMNRLDDARDYYLKAEKVSGGNNPDIAYNISCVESMSGRLELALQWLNNALQRGYHDEYSIRTNQELVIVREDGRFERLMGIYFKKYESVR